MRIVFCSLLLVAVHTCLWAQATIDFKTKSLPQLQLNSQFSEFSVYELPKKLDLQPKSNTSPVDVVFKFGQQQFEISLQKTEMLTQAYKAFALSPNQSKTQVFLDVQTYDGHLKGYPEHSVKLTTSDDFLYGFITTPSETYYLEPMNRFDQNAKHQVIVYPASAVTHTNTKCAVSDQQQVHDQLRYHPQVKEIESGKGNSCKEIHLAMVHDYSMFLKYNEDIESLFAYTIGVLNNVQSNYSSAFNGNLKFKVTEQVVPICSNCDLWTTSTDPGVLLLDFLNWGNQQNLVNNFHIGQFWTNRDLDGTTVGYAYVGATCSPFNYQIIQDFSTNASKMRMVVAHELGHNLNAQHNAISQGNIMDPVVSSASSWSAQSVSTINSYVGSLTCLNGCQSASCPPVSNLLVDQNLMATWSLSLANQFHVQIIDNETESIVFQQIQSQNSFDLNGVLDLCMDYLFKVTAICPNQNSETRSAFLQSSFDSQLTITKVVPVNCNSGLYDIELEVSYEGTKTGNFIVEIGGQLFYYDYIQSPQNIVVHGLNATGSVDVPIKVYDAITGITNCSDEFSVDAPDAYCNYQYVESFDNCALPVGWLVNNNNLDSTVNWKFGGANRNVTNYPAGTIDGTCMAFFDDDLSINSTGIIEMESPSFDLVSFSNLLLEFQYDFHSFSGGLKPAPHDYNNSSFEVEVWDGGQWISIFTHQGPDNCFFNQFWSCPPPAVVLNLDPYNNAALKIRFRYDDDGKWAGAVGIDNFTIRGSNTCGNNHKLIQTTAVQHANQECTDETGWTHYWNSAYPETILLSIYKNNDPTFTLIPANVQTGVDMNNPVMLIPNSIPYVQHPDGFYVSSRYWNVAPLQQPTHPVLVRFYYSQPELQLLLDQIGLSSVNDLSWFKFTTSSGVDPNPKNGHLEAHPDDILSLQPVFGTIGTISFAEFEVESFSGGGVGGYGSNLPVELVDFTGTVLDQSVLLEWTTYSEQNSKAFIVERSQDGITYSEIGVAAAAGNSVSSRQYRLVDQYPLSGTSYYRLKLVDLDGNSDYSKVIAVQYSKGKGIVVLSANPGTGPIKLGIDWDRNETITLNLTGIDGRRLISDSYELSTGFNEITLDTDHLGAGSYFIHLEGRGFIDAVKVIKVD